MTTSIIAVGNATLDRIWRVAYLPAPGHKMRSTDYVECGGGQAANAAVAAARLGGSARLVSVVGDDEAGRIIRAQLVGDGVDVSCVQVVEGARSISSAILVDAMGERVVVGDVDRRLHAQPTSLDLSIVATARAVVADVKWPAAAEPILREARRLAIPTVLDVEPAAPGHHERLCPLADHAIFGQEGLAVFSGTDNPDAGLAIAYGRLGGTVGVTLGAAGVRLLNSDGAIAVAAPKVAVVDTTGAGDAFHGAYALAIGEGQDARSAARFAAATAALKCTKTGGRAGLPTRAELERFMKGA